ncbi:MAG: alanine:cation symporter family protein [Clostridium sp.]|nr:alanine:cation symporter family protein [Clostridium sp.]MCM1443791.1 alanine:cation symporter family protein [Candidatus Amulumruptor caecigallinarius]
MQYIIKTIWFIATILILISSIYFTFKLKGIQFRFKDMFKSLKKNKEVDGISNFQVLMISLAGRMGVGSIAGVSLAIYMGGIGSIFWLVATVFLCSTNTFCEIILGGIYKEHDEKKQYKGGPSYYIKNGLNNKKLGALYAILIIIGYIIFFVGIQSNTISKSLVGVNPVLLGIILSVITFLIIYGGLSKIARFSSFIVPFMTIIYIIASLVVFFQNISDIPSILLNVVREAFNFKPFFSGFLSGFLIGIQRGIFSNEAGIGTSSIVSTSSTSNNLIKQGYIQMLGIYITTFIICISTAIIVLTSDYLTVNGFDINGIELTKHAFIYHFGSFGNIILTVSIILFSFSTVTTAYYYGESCLKYFGNVNKFKILILKIITCIIVFMGCIISSSFLWGFVDIIVAFLIIINTYAILRLKQKILDYVNKSR